MIEKIKQKILGSQLRLNLFSGVFTAALSFIISIVKYPIFLGFMSFELYGVWLILTTILTFAQMGLTGVSVGLVKLVSEEHAKDNVAEIEKYISTSLAMLTAFGLLIILILVVYKHEVISAIGLTGSNAELGLRYLPYIGVLSLYVFLYEIINATLSGLGRMDIANYSQTLIQTIPLVIAVPLLMMNVPEIFSMFVAHSFAYILVTAINFKKIKSIVKLRFFIYSNISYIHFNKMLSFSGAIFISSLVSLLFFPISKIIVSRNLGVSFVPIYEVAFRASSQLTSVFSMGFCALIPEISRLSSIATEFSSQKIDKINSKAYKISLIGGSSVCVIVYFLAELIFKLWLGKKYNAEIVSCFRVMLFGTLVCTATLVPYYNFIGKGKIRIIVVYHCIAPIVSILSLMILSALTKTTLMGVAFSNALGFTLGTLFLSWYAITSQDNKVVNSGINS